MPRYGQDALGRAMKDLATNAEAKRLVALEPASELFARKDRPPTTYGVGDPRQPGIRRRLRGINLLQRPEPAE